MQLNTNTMTYQFSNYTKAIIFCVILNCECNIANPHTYHSLFNRKVKAFLSYFT